MGRFWFPIQEREYPVGARVCGRNQMVAPERTFWNYSREVRVSPLQLFECPGNRKIRWYRGNDVSFRPESIWLRAFFIWRWSWWCVRSAMEKWKRDSCRQATWSYGWRKSTISPCFPKTVKSCWEEITWPALRFPPGSADNAAKWSPSMKKIRKLNSKRSLK